VAERSGRYPLGLRLIGGFKFVCGLLLVALAVGLFRGANGDFSEKAADLIAKLRLDPENHYIHTAIEKITHISPKQLRAISAGTFLYALLYLVEGGGLLLKKRWAEYFTVFATGFFIPLEIYEVYERPSAGTRVGLLVINVAIVVYLIYQLRNKRREEAGADKVPASSSAT
jgi:uncharacterized membrane protein (DUF2068 family)